MFHTNAHAGSMVFAPNVLGLCAGPTTFNFDAMKNALMNMAPIPAARQGSWAEPVSAQNEVGRIASEESEAHDNLAANECDSTPEFAVYEDQVYYLYDDEEPLEMSTSMARVLSQSEASMSDYLSLGPYEYTVEDELNALAVPGLAYFTPGASNSIPELDALSDCDSDTDSECSSLASFESDKFIGASNEDGAYEIVAPLVDAKENRIIDHGELWASWGERARTLGA